MSVSRIKRNDEVIVIAGAANGQHGKVIRVDRRGQRAIVEGVNVVKKTFKKSQRDPEGAIRTKEMPVALSNLQPFDAEAKKGVRIRRVREETRGVRKAVGSERELA